jgi:hypothetical protein
MSDKLDPRLELLDGVAKALAKVAGFDAGERLITHFGGQRVFVPRTVRPRSRLWQQLGPIAAKALATLRGGEHIDVPTGSEARRRLNDVRVRLQIESYLKAQGNPAAVSKDQVAERFKVNRRTVQRVRVALQAPRDDKQGSLFEGPSKRP